jgi:DNA primase
MDYTVNEISLEICRRLGIDVKGKTSGNVLVKCISPNHNDNSPSCSISLDKGVYHCFSCGASGSLKNEYYQRFGRSIYRDMGIQRPLGFKVYDQDLHKANFDITPDVDFVFTGQFFEVDAVDISRAWIKSRGFKESILKQLRIKFIKYGKTVQKSDPENKDEWMTFRDMVIIPIYEKGKLISFEARDVKGKKAWEESLIAKGFDPKDYHYKKVLYPKHSSVNSLYQLDYLKNEKLYITEGLMDVIALRSDERFLNSTSSFGVQLTERQIYLLSKFKEVCLIPNNDLPGITAIQKLKDKKMKNVTILPLPKTLNDVNDILQKKDKRYNSIDDLIEMNWLSKEIPLEEFDVNLYIQAKEIK